MADDILEKYKKDLTDRTQDASQPTAKQISDMAKYFETGGNGRGGGIAKHTGISPSTSIFSPSITGVSFGAKGLDVSLAAISFALSGYGRIATGPSGLVSGAALIAAPAKLAIGGTDNEINAKDDVVEVMENESNVSKSQVSAVDGEAVVIDNRL